MTPEQLATLAAGGESETLEFKRSTGGRREAARAVCAMLNHRGGHVLFGVTPEGSLVGQDVSDRTIEQVSQEMARIDPPVHSPIEQVPLPNGRHVLVVSVSRGYAKPYSYRGDAYHRTGNTNRRMSRAEYNQMLFERMHSEQRWENQSAIGWSVDDLDVAEVRRTVEESIRRGRAEDPGTRDPEELLRGLGLMRDGVLLRAAAVLFGASDRLEAAMPQCLLRVARFRGVDRTEFLDNRQFHGNAFGLLVQAERFLRETLPVSGRVLTNVFERVDDPLYPPVALREALANALCHRDYAIGGGSVAVAVYDDRLEVTSSGSLPFGLTADQLFAPHESLPWNPLIARVFYRRGVIEQWGRGTLKMAELATAAGLPRPSIEDCVGRVTVCFRHSQYIPPQRVGLNLTDQQQAILALLNQTNEGLALREIRQRLDPYERLNPYVGNRQVQQDLATLKRFGLARVTGHGRGARWNRT